MRLTYFIATSVAALLATSSVQAADMVKSNTVGEVAILKVASASNFSWDGAYLGLLGSFNPSSTAAQTIDLAAEQDKRKNKVYKGSQSFVGNKSSQDHYNVGLVGGYNFSLDNGFVVGVELDALYTAKSGEVTREKGDAVEGKTVLEETEDFFDVKSDDFKRSSDTEESVNLAPVLSDGKLLVADKKSSPLFTGSLNARAGYAVGNLLPFVTAGVKANYLSETTKGVKEYNTTAPAVKKDGQDPEYDKKTTASKLAFGYSVGAGVDYAVIKNVVLRAEYRFSNILSKSEKGTRDYSYQRPESEDGTITAQDLNVTYTDGAGYNSSHEVRVGVAYKF